MLSARRAHTKPATQKRLAVENAHERPGRVRTVALEVEDFTARVQPLLGVVDAEVVHRGHTLCGRIAASETEAPNMLVHLV